MGADEIFISDGSKCDTGNIWISLATTIELQLLIRCTRLRRYQRDGRSHRPIDENGRYGGLVYLPGTEANQFVPELPKERVDLIYLCFPNNPTGTVADKATLKKWVYYARQNDSIILFDAAYEAFISDPTIPHSIYEIEGARDVAIEFRSFSKTLVSPVFAVPDGCTKAAHRPNIEWRASVTTQLWNRRQSTKFNGASYVVRKARRCIFTRWQGSDAALIDFYMTNARLLREGLQSLGIRVFGGVNAPYVWLKTPKNLSSWDFFDLLLSKANLVGTPGSGFGAAGEGYFRSVPSTAAKTSKKHSAVSQTLFNSGPAQGRLSLRESPTPLTK